MIFGIDTENPTTLPQKGLRPKTRRQFLQRQSSHQPEHVRCKVAL